MSWLHLKTPIKYNFNILSKGFAMKALSTNGIIAAEDPYYLMAANPNIKLLDATYASPDPSLTPFQAFLSQRINGAQFFDIDVVADQDAPLPHTVPSTDYFAACVSALSISNDDHVVVYDQSGAYMASSRAWWMFRLFGHNNVYVLEGGINAWISRGFPVTTGNPQEPTATNFAANLNKELLVTRNYLMENLETKTSMVIDARPSMRFDGAAPEPRPSMRSGHIPRSYNIPFGDVLDGQSSFFKHNSELEKTFSQIGLSKDSKAIISCGSGVTACTVALAMFKARGQEAAVYDGSWAEWGDERAGTPIEFFA